MGKTKNREVLSKHIKLPHLFQGKTINLSSFDFTNIYSLHMEFNITFND